MILIQGQGVSKGIAVGTLTFYRRKNVNVQKNDAQDSKTEMARFEQAQGQIAARLHALAQRCRKETGEESALLFETHAMLAMDEDFSEEVKKQLEETNCGAETAVQEAGERFAALFAQMEDEYMRARAADIRDVARQMVEILQNAATEDFAPNVPMILAADDFAPSETVRMDRRDILALVTRKGSPNSHTAILARMLGIPAVCALGDALQNAHEGRTVCVDGDSGRLIVDPDEETLRLAREVLERKRAQDQSMEQLRGKEDVTLDGQTMHVHCNIGSPADIEAVKANDGQGIGLFRSEFLFLGAQQWPSEEMQLNAYKSVAEAMKGKRVIIRTLDMGADKRADFWDLPREENPALGVRGVRLSLNRMEMFRTQLRALYRASAFGHIAILFPMIASEWEWRTCRSLCESVMAELRAARIPFREDVELGVMIETPASVWIARELARQADFFSVGTNDLSQYLLACDRQNGELERFFDPHHPAVLRAIAMAAEAAHAAGRWVGVCGELAADLSMLPFFLAVGVDELSVSPKDVLPLRRAIRSSNAEQCAAQWKNFCGANGT